MICDPGMLCITPPGISGDFRSFETRARKNKQKKTQDISLAFCIRTNGVYIDLKYCFEKKSHVLLGHQWSAQQQLSNVCAKKIPKTIPQAYTSAFCISTNKRRRSYTSKYKICSTVFRVPRARTKHYTAVHSMMVLWRTPAINFIFSSKMGTDRNSSPTGTCWGTWRRQRL